jgi:hypothetical protein
MAIPMATGIKVMAPSSRTLASGVVTGTQLSPNPSNTTAIA